MGALVAMLLSMTLSTLRARLRELDGQSYGGYRRLKGRYDMGSFELVVDHVQGDPFAAPSRVILRVPTASMGIAARDLETEDRLVGVGCYLARRFRDAESGTSRVGGSGSSGRVMIDAPGQVVSRRSCLWVNQEILEARVSVGLPANGRRILGRQAEALLTEALPERVATAWRLDDSARREATRWAEVNEDAEALRSELGRRGHIAFVADGSVLPRRSGASDEPMGGEAVAFESPPEFAEVFEAPNAGPLRGMAISEGVTVIVGGGFHGKSTLLRALERGIYNHCPGDGRERVVTRRDAVKIRAEDGRRASCLPISPFISGLPNGADTHEFSTENASGSTSQAVNMAEALEMGSRVFLIDEDTAATNFMSRDRVMRALVASDREPIRCFSETAPALQRELGLSVVMAMGSASAFFELADRVIAMTAYRPSDVTGNAKRLSRDLGASEDVETPDAALADSFYARMADEGASDSFVGPKGVRSKARGLDSVTIGRSDANLRYCEQLVDPSQVRAIAAAIERLVVDGGLFGKSLREVCDTIESQMRRGALNEVLGTGSGELAAFRAMDLAMALNRLEGLRFLRNPNQGD